MRGATVITRTINLALVLLVVMGPLSSVRADEKSSAENAKARMEAAKKFYKGYLARQTTGVAAATPFDPELLYRWSVRWMEAQSDLNDKKEDRVRAAEEHLVRMKDLEGTVTELVKNGLIRGYEPAAAEFYRLEAEKWLAERKAK